MKHFCTILLICITACEQKNKSEHNVQNNKNAQVNNIVSELRYTVSKTPVASYLISMGDPRLDRKFGVEIYETRYTFKYILAMQYDGMVQNDTLKIPNFGSLPVVKIIPGKEKLSCIIGFLDKENTFREYKMLSAQNDKLKLTVLKGYVVSAY